MSEQELRQQFKDHSDCYSDSIEVIQAMTEDAAIALAKAYADAQVDAAVGRAMNEVGRISVEYNTQIAAKDAEIKRMREGVEELRKLGDDVVKHVNRNDLSRAKMHASRWDPIWDKWRVYIRDSKAVVSPAPVTEGNHDNGLPTEDEIHFVAMDESNADRHGWISLNQKPAYVDGFEDGAKWMRTKKTI